jgi:hypothetical protein
MLQGICSGAYAPGPDDEEEEVVRMKANINGLKL